MKKYKTDVAIIGGGIAGIVAAIDLLDKNKKVIILEKDIEENFGGLAKESFGGILMVGTPEQKRLGIKDSPELALQDWLSFGDFGKDPKSEKWGRVWAEHYVNESRQWIYNFLKSKGVKFLPVPLWVERGLYGEGNSVPRWHVVWGTGEGLIKKLIQALEEHQNRANLTILFEHQVNELQTQNGKITGCTGKDLATRFDFELEAENTIVATGGINGSLEKVRENWHKDWGQAPQIILNGAHKFADGNMHSVSEKQGANIINLDKMWNYAAGVHHWKPRKPLHGLSLVPPKSALWLNAYGERIAPMPLVSGFDTRDLVTQVCNQEHGYSWQLMNMRIAKKELAISGAEFNPSIRKNSKVGLLKEILFGNSWLLDQIKTCKDFVMADTLEELVKKMNALENPVNVELASVENAVFAYDNEIARGANLFNDEQLRRIEHLRKWRADKLRTCKPKPISANPPFIAIREFIISRKSLGGIETNLESQVLSKTGEPIQGLYAVGEAAGFGGGGINGLRGLEGTFLGGCIYSARKAAASI